MNNPEEKKTIVKGNLNNVRALVVNPHMGIMYWTIWQFDEDSPGKVSYKYAIMPKNVFQIIIRILGLHIFLFNFSIVCTKSKI